MGYGRWENSACVPFAAEHRRPRHDDVHDARREDAHACDRRPVPPAAVPSFQPRACVERRMRAVGVGVVVMIAVVVVVVRVVAVGVVWLDDVGRDPHLHGAAAARGRADGGPADERALLVPEHGQRELGGGPADR